MKRSVDRTSLIVLKNAPLVIFIAVFVVFSLASSRFLTPENLLNIVVQSSSVAIVAVGMTFVLLTAGIDLSVGAVMFLTAAVAGKLVLSESIALPIPLAMLVMVAIGAAWGLGIGLLVTRLQLAPFIVTLAAILVGKGLGLWLTNTRALNLPDGFRQIATGGVFGLPFPVLILIAVVVVAQTTLSWTPLGRQIYAVGHDVQKARTAGIPVSRVLVSVYVASGICAAIGGIVTVAQLGAVSPTLGDRREFDAIAAAVLGGTSLFGGRGRVFPGTVLGAVLIQTLYNGLNILNADPYSYPLITAATIFGAVLIDSLRQRHLVRLARRRIRVEELGSR